MVPDTALFPDQLPEATQLSALDVDQVRLYELL